MSRDQALEELLRSLPGQSFKNDLDMVRDIIPRLAAILGYDESETFYEYGGGARLRADVVLSRSIDAPPWIVIELKRGRSANPADWAYQLRSYLDAFGSRIGLVLSPEILIFVSDEGVRRIELKSITSEQVGEISQALRRSSQPEPVTAESLAHTRLIELIERVESASTNEEKGRSLEALSKFLFNSVASLHCKYANLRTRSSEIDLVIEYNPAPRRIPLFEELGRYCLVECKNWSKPVGVGPVRDFMGKLDKCKARLGVVFSRNGVTGVDSGVDALREIQSRFDRDGVFLLVFSLDDLRSISDGRAFLAALDRKADALRFDTEGG
jgi:hypothetical protein